MRLLTSLALVTIGYAALSRVSKLHAARLSARSAAKPDAVQTWEGEGGGPAGGGTGAGVKVAPAPASMADPDLAHGGA
jgi:hypothetical protein